VWIAPKLHNIYVLTCNNMQTCCCDTFYPVIFHGLSTPRGAVKLEGDYGFAVRWRAALTELIC
jgi:hypothetical protein